MKTHERNQVMKAVAVATQLPLSYLTTVKRGKDGKSIETFSNWYKRTLRQTMSDLHDDVLSSLTPAFSRPGFLSPAVPLKSFERDRYIWGCDGDPL